MSFIGLFRKELRLILYHISCDIPLNTLDSPFFRDFLKECGVLLRSGDVLKGHVSLLHSIIREKTESKLKTAETMTLTLDGWTDMNDIRYTGVTYHFIDQNWCLHSIAGDVIFMPQRHTSREIASSVMERVNEKVSQTCLISAVVSDSASNMVNACARILAWEIEKDMDEIVVDDDNDAFFIDNEKYGWRCFDHVLNLVVRGVVDNEALLVCSDVKRIQEIVVVFRTSTALSQEFADFQRESGHVPLQFEYDVKTRWASTLYLIRKALRLKDRYLQFIETGKMEFELREKF